MVHFNDLRFSKDSKYLIIDAAIDSQNFYENVLLDSIIIDNQDTFVSNGPSSNPIYTYKITDIDDKVYATPENCNCSPIRIEDDSYCFVEGTSTMKQVRLEVPLSLYGIDPYKDMLFVYVIASGTPSADTPCGLDNSKIMGTVVNLKYIYDNILCYIRQIENECEIPKNFIDSILKYKALELSIRTGNYPLAIKYWKKYISNSKPVISTIKTCNCHG